MHGYITTPFTLVSKLNIAKPMFGALQNSRNQGDSGVGFRRHF